MQPHQAVSLPSQSATQNAGLNGNARHRRQESDAAGVSIDENAILIKELHLLATKVEQLNTANRRKTSSWPFSLMSCVAHWHRSSMALLSCAVEAARTRLCSMGCTNSSKGRCVKSHSLPLVFSMSDELPVVTCWLNESGSICDGFGQGH